MLSKLNKKSTNAAKNKAPQPAPVVQADRPKKAVSQQLKINWNDQNAKVSKYFTVREVTSGDPRRIPKDIKIEKNIKKFAINLDKLRDRFGRMKINSWYRPEPINSAVGGAKNSQHVNGWAADIDFGANKKEVEKWLEKNWVGGVGSGVISGKGYTHLDMGPNRRWKY
jgi:uncharacterized protein YcbK (DUF882 family)